MTPRSRSTRLERHRYSQNLTATADRLHLPPLPPSPIDYFPHIDDVRPATILCRKVPCAQLRAQDVQTTQLSGNCPRCGGSRSGVCCGGGGPRGQQQRQLAHLERIRSSLVPPRGRCGTGQGWPRHQLHQARIKLTTHTIGSKSSKVQLGR